MFRKKIEIGLPRICLSVAVEKVGWRIPDQRQVGHAGHFPEIDLRSVGRHSADVRAHAHDAERQLNGALTRHATEHLKGRCVSEILQLVEIPNLAPTSATILHVFLIGARHERLPRT